MATNLENILIWRIHVSTSDILYIFYPLKWFRHVSGLTHVKTTWYIFGSLFLFFCYPSSSTTNLSICLRKYLRTHFNVMCSFWYLFSCWFCGILAAMNRILPISSSLIRTILFNLTSQKWVAVHGLSFKIRKKYKKEQIIKNYIN